MIRLDIQQLKNGKWAAFSGNKYFAATVRDTEREARVARLHQIGREAQARIDEVDNRLRELGALDESDPHGYLA
jgi:hypothetical protein